jgi:putative oxidoreductase
MYSQFWFERHIRSTCKGAEIMDGGLLVARLVLGVLMAAHGSQKLFGWFGGYGLDGTVGLFEALGFRPGRLFVTAASVAEIAGGLLLAAGFFTPLASGLIVAVMIVAAVSVHWQHGVFATSNGIEVPLLYGTGAVALALTGPGAYSVDAVVGLTSYWTTLVALAAIAVGAIGGVTNLAMRRLAGQPVAV